MTIMTEHLTAYFRLPCVPLSKDEKQKSIASVLRKRLGALISYNASPLCAGCGVTLPQTLYLFHYHQLNYLRCFSAGVYDAFFQKLLCDEIFSWLNAYSLMP